MATSRGRGRGPARSGGSKGAPKSGAKGAPAARGRPSSTRGGAGAGRAAAGAARRRSPTDSSAAARRGGRGVASGGKPRGARGKPAERGLGGEQVEGRQAVRELLLAGRRRTQEVVLAADLDAAPILDDIRELAAELRVPLREISRSKLEAQARTDAPQGVIATAMPIPEAELEDLVVASAGAPAPFLVALDGVTDPGNLGAVLRSAECAGVTGVLLPRHRSVHVTPTVAKAAAGAVERLPMALVSGLPTAITQLRDAGVWVVGLDAGGDRSVWDLSVATEPVCLVLGSEGDGLSRLVRQRCDQLVGIPLQGQMGSLNVSVAGALAVFEVARRRWSAGHAS